MHYIKIIRVIFIRENVNFFDLVQKSANNANWPTPSAVLTPSRQISTHATAFCNGYFFKNLFVRIENGA